MSAATTTINTEFAFILKVSPAGLLGLTYPGDDSVSQGLRTSQGVPVIIDPNTEGVSASYDQPTNLISIRIPCATLTEDVDLEWTTRRPEPTTLDIDPWRSFRPQRFGASPA